MQEIISHTDAQLVKNTLENKDNFRYIIERYQAPLSGYIARRARVSSFDIDDILQDIFIKVYTHLNDYDDSLKFSSWIYRIAHNYIIDWYRKHKRDPAISLDDEAQSISAMLEDTDIDIYQYKTEEKKETLQSVNHALAKILPDYREILLLRFVEEKSYEEISDILKISKTSVGVKINRAKQALKKHINSINI